MSSSESVGVRASPEFTIGAAIVADDANHFVHFRSDLNAASKANEGRVAFASIYEPLCLSAWLLVERLEPWAGDVHGTLGAVHAGTERVIGHLVWSHLVLVISTVAVWVDPGHLVPVQHFEEGFAGTSSHTSRDTIGRHAVDPDDMVGHLNASVFGSWAQSMPSKHNARRLS